MHGDDARDAWEANNDDLMKRAKTRHPGGRPVGYWVFDVKRPDLLGDLDEDDWRKCDAWEQKRIAWLREQGSYIATRLRHYQERTEPQVQRGLRRA